MPQLTTEVRNAEGLTIPGYLGKTGTDPFANLPTNTDFLYNWLATRNAIRRDATFATGMTNNDLLNNWRNIAVPGQTVRGSTGAVGTHLFLDGTRKVGQIVGANAAQNGTYRASVAVADASLIEAKGGVLVPTAATARVRFPTAAGVGDSSIGVLGVFAVDSADTAAAFYVGCRAADASNDIRASYLNSATPTLTLNRNVATVLSAEVVANAGNAPVAGQINYVAIGLRISGTTGSIFCNGVKVGTVTLNAAGLALTGNGIVMGFTAGLRPVALVLSAMSLS